MPALADRLDELQERLWVEGTRSLLVVLQGMDTSGKGGTVRHVFSAMNPAGVEVAVVQEADRGGARAPLPVAHRAEAPRRPAR